MKDSVRTAAYKWIARKKLPAHKVGRLWKFQVSGVNEWARAGKAAEKVETATGDSA
ncbi:MAG: helix-turn-helix domain-containing protein [Verrucomicrobiota bacterium]|nr:helix-turn-helix domain-containing protein [Verrucomicrobiota bacterium]